MVKKSVRNLSVFLLLFMTACTPQLQLNEDIQYLQALAHDVNDKGEVETTGITTIIMPADEQVPESELITTSNANLASLYEGLQAESPRIIDSSRTRLHIFSETFAKEEGLFDTLDAIQRNPSIEQNLKLLISRGSASDLFNARYPFHSTAQRHLLDLIEKNEIEQLPKSSMHEFLYRYYATGTDAFIPVVDRIGDHAKITGLALFQGDKYRTEINLQQSSYFRKLFEKTTHGNAYVALGEGKGIVYRYIKSEPSWDVSKNQDGSIAIDVTLRMEGTLRQKKDVAVGEITTGDLEQRSKEHFEAEFTKMISFLQEENLDPIGITEFVRHHVRGIDIGKWKEEQYSTTPVNVHVRFQVNNRGAVK